MSRDPGPPEDDLKALTDAELLGRYRLQFPESAEDRARAVFQRVEAELIARPTPETWDRWQSARDAIPQRNSEGRRFLSEMTRRLRLMIRTARLAQALSLDDLSRMSGGTYPNLRDRLEFDQLGQGQWSSVHPHFFRSMCVGDCNEPDLAAYWSLILDHPWCRTIRPESAGLAEIARRGGAAVDLARTIARGRSFDLLPVLGDALEEAGCSDAEARAHCREPGDHLIGCWVTDALAGTRR
jgi:hypothetical protein